MNFPKRDGKPTQLYFSISKPLFDSTTGIVAITRKQIIIHIITFILNYKTIKFWFKWVYFDLNSSLFSIQAHFQNTPRPI